MFVGSSSPTLGLNKNTGEPRPNKPKIAGLLPPNLFYLAFVCIILKESVKNIQRSATLEKPNKSHRIGGAFFGCCSCNCCCCCCCTLSRVSQPAESADIQQLSFRRDSPGWLEVIHRVRVGGWCWYELTIQQLVFASSMLGKKTNNHIYHIFPNGGISIKSKTITQCSLKKSGDWKIQRRLIPDQ